MDGDFEWSSASICRLALVAQPYDGLISRQPLQSPAFPIRKSSELSCGLYESTCLSFRIMFQTRVLCAEQAAATLNSIRFNRFRAQKIWPPDFAKIPPKQQLRLERKYRRRAKLRYARPGWVKGVKLANWGVCLGMRARGQVRRSPPPLAYL